MIVNTKITYTLKKFLSLKKLVYIIRLIRFVEIFWIIVRFKPVSFSAVCTENLKILKV